MFGKFIIAGACVVLAGGVLAGDVITWTGQGSDNLWTTKENWDPQSVPTSKDEAHFPSGNWTIDIGGTRYYGDLFFDAGVGAVTFEGEGVFKPSSGSVLSLPTGRELAVDGCKFNLPHKTMNSGVYRVKSGELAGDDAGSVLGNDCRLLVEGGCFSSVVTLTITNNAELLISGGLVEVKTYVVCGAEAPEKGGLIRLTGGVLHNTYGNFPYTSQVREGGRLENLGGTILWGTTSNDTRSRITSAAVSDNGQGAAFSNFLPRVGSALIVPSHSIDSSGCLRFSVVGDYADVGGSIFVTNNVTDVTLEPSVAAGNVVLAASNVVLRGGATISANALNAASGAQKTTYNYDFDLTRLNLGMGGIRRKAVAGFQYFNFLDGIVFGSWGDYVSSDEGSSGFLKVVLSGPVVYETLDCFDQETKHTVSMSNVKLDDVTDFKATGGGTVTLSPLSFTDEFRTLEVADDTTLAFAGAANLKAMNLKLGANAILKLDLSDGGCVDAAATATFGTGAKIVVTALPATLTTGKFYPIYFAPAGTDPDLAKIEYAEGDWPSGWKLDKTGGAVYLTDGMITTKTIGETKTWSGAGADNDFANTDNWISNVVPGSASSAIFPGFSNTVIVVKNNRTLRAFTVPENGGPYMFSGSTLTFNYPSSATGGQASLNNFGKFPLVVGNVVKAAYAVRCMAYGEGPIALTGGSTQGVPLDFGGDIRLGADWTAQYLRVVPKWSLTVSRNSRLTVMPGVTLTVTDQDGDVNDKGAGAIAVAAGGTATISGTQLLLTSNNTHYVDGALTVNCPLVAQGRQSFRGDGTLTLAGGIADASVGGVRVEGNLTLIPMNLVNNAVLAIKDNVTIAPAADWTFGGGATLDLENHSTLTLATGGHKLTLAKPIVSEGALAVTGTGTLEIAATGLTLGTLNCANGVKLSISESLFSSQRSVDVLSVREDNASIAFDSDLLIKKRVDATTGRTIYSAARRPGLVIIVK